jgi:hypothetical protein
LRKRFEFRLGQEAIAKLNSSQVVEDHGAASRIERCRSGGVAGGKSIRILLHTTGALAVCK